MRSLVFIVMLALCPLAGANAQTLEQQLKGMGATVMALTQENVALRTQLVMAEEKIAAMKTEKPTPDAGK